MPTTSNFGWTTPADTDLVKDGAAAIRTLGNGVDTSFVDLKGGTTGQVLAKASGSDLDFSWVTTDDANAIQNAIVDAKGDLIAASAADTPARLAVGTNDFVLAAASGETTGLKWKQEGLTLITSTAFSNSATIAVDSVFTSTYANYLIEVVTTSGSGGAAEIQLRFRTSGSANSNASYNNAGSAYTYAAATENAATASGTSAFVMRTNGGQWCGRLNVFNPQATQLTWWLGQFADSAQTGYRGGYFNATTSFDGFQLVNSGATNVAGTIRVYGMAN